MSLEINTDDFWKELDQRVLDARTERKLFIEEITKLRKQVAAQAADIRTLEIEFGDVRDSFLLYKEKTQAQAAVIEKLREALIAGWSLQCDFDDARQLADDALAIPTDSTQILDEVRRAERERCAKVCDAKAAGDRYVYQREELIELAAAIRAME